jgi:hypothetical protein
MKTDKKPVARKLSPYWKQIDWRQKDSDIARQFGVMRASVHELRARLYRKGLIETGAHEAKLSEKRYESHAILIDLVPGGSIRVRMPTLHDSIDIREKGEVMELARVTQYISAVLKRQLYPLVQEFTKK